MFALDIYSPPEGHEVDVDDTDCPLGEVDQTHLLLCSETRVWKQQRLDVMNITS